MAKPPSKRLQQHTSLNQRATRLFRTVGYLPLFVAQSAEKQASQSDEWTHAGLSCPVAPDQGDGLGIRKSNAVGGQAVIEGVMMRGAHHVATAVRAPDQKIICKVDPFEPFANRSKLFKLPVLRGAGMLFETLKLGISTLDWSAKIAQPEAIDAEQIKWWEKILAKLAMPIGLLAGISLFLWLPYSVAKWTVGNDANQFLYHLVSNGLQITLMVTYMYVISLSAEIRRVFEYHGAEHKGIAAYESGAPVEPTSMKAHSRFHARCGTSFLLVLALVTMVFFSIFDGTLLWLGYVYPNAIIRVITHLPFVPVVAGIGYEVLKFSDRKKSLKLVTMMIQPGLWLQRITTKEPASDQLEVSATSLRAAIIGAVEVSDTVVEYKAD